MANKTVYPFGTDGQIPASIGVINDMKTGGANKALSAEQGKIIGGVISEDVTPKHLDGSLLVTAGSATGQTVVDGFGVSSGHLYRIVVQSDDIVLSAASMKIGLGSNGDIVSNIGTSQLRRGVVLTITATTTAASSRVYVTITSAILTTGGTVKARIEDLTDTDSLPIPSSDKFINPGKLNFLASKVEDSVLSWEYGGLDNTTGAETVSASAVRSTFIPIDAEPQEVTLLYKDRYSFGYGPAVLLYYDASKEYTGTTYASGAKFVRVKVDMYGCDVTDDLDVTMYMDGVRIPCGYHTPASGEIAYRNYVEGLSPFPYIPSVAVTVASFPVTSGSDYSIYLKSDKLVTMLSGTKIKFGLGGSNGSKELTPAELYAGYTWNVTASNTQSTCRLYADLSSGNTVGDSFTVYSKIQDASSGSLRTPYMLEAVAGGGSASVDKLKELGFGYIGTKTSVTLVHCSDIHADTERWQRISKFASDNSMVAIHTGDNLKSKWNSDGGFDFLLDSGVTNIMNCVGNHDGKKGNDWFGATPKEIYDELFAPYIAGWDVVQPTDAAEDGLLYYYKDLGTSVRLIVLDLHNVDQNAGDYTPKSETVAGYTAAELSWFESVLADAITNNKAVVVATHYILDNLICDIETAWDEGRNKPHWAETDSARYGCINTQFVDAVSDFLDNGGNFVCWLSGHLHVSQFSHSSDDERQLQVVVANASMPPYADSGHVRSTVSDYEDDFDVVKIYPDDYVIIINRIGSNLTRLGLRQRIIAYDYKNNELLYSQE